MVKAGITMSITKGQKSVLITGYVLICHPSSCGAIGWYPWSGDKLTALQLLARGDWACACAGVPFERWVALLRSRRSGNFEERAELDELGFVRRDMGLMEGRTARYSNGAHQRHHRRSRGFGVFDCQFGGDEHGEH
jgi:hypothetical protein